MAWPANQELLKKVAQADFDDRLDALDFNSRLPKRKRLSHLLGLYVPSFEEYEKVMGKRHRNDPRG